MLNIGDTLLPSKPSDTQIADATDHLMNGYAAPSSPRSTGQMDSLGKDYATGTARNLRSIVEGRFMRMSEAHDRIRTELLTSHPSHMR